MTAPFHVLPDGSVQIEPWATHADFCDGTCKRNPKADVCPSTWPPSGNRAYVETEAGSTQATKGGSE